MHAAGHVGSVLLVLTGSFHYGRDQISCFFPGIRGICTSLGNVWNCGPAADEVDYPGGLHSCWVDALGSWELRGRIPGRGL